MIIIYKVYNVVTKQPVKQKKMKKKKKLKRRGRNIRYRNYHKKRTENEIKNPLNSKEKQPNVMQETEMKDEGM